MGANPALERRPLVSPEGQSATFVELFFDLVFVFSVTQVVYLLAHDLTWNGVAESVLVFWLVWWAWTQFTWALNAADTTHPWVEFFTLLATAVAFFLAVSVPSAFHGSGHAFALSYVAVRAIGLGLYVAVASDASHRAAIGRFATLSVAGLVAVVVGAFLGGSGQFVAWGLAIALDILAGVIGGASSEWRLHAEHFAERHGLIVIIALGEGLIAAAAGVAGQEWSWPLFGAATLSVVLTCALWWSYFVRLKPELEHALARAPAEKEAGLARDAFSVLHFPLVYGIVTYAVAIEESIAHPADPLPFPARAALAAGLGLFLVSSGLARWRTGCGRPVARLAFGAAGAAAILLIDGPAPMVLLAVALLPVVAVAVADSLRD